MDDDRAVGTGDHTDLQQVPGGVGANEHRQAVIEVIDEDWVVEGVDHVVVADAVLAGARGDQWSIPVSQVLAQREVAGCRAKISTGGRLISGGPSPPSVLDSHSGGWPVRLASPPSPLSRHVPFRAPACRTGTADLGGGARTW